MTRPSLFIVAVGGTQRATSSTASALRFCLQVAERMGARTKLLSGPALDLPNYDTTNAVRPAAATELVEALRAADGVILASPGYHGGVSGLIKNALDYTEDMARDPVPYLAGRAVGCIAAGAGWQAGGPVLASLRAITHALRAWPTPLGVQLNSVEPLFDADGKCLNPAVAGQLEEMTRQVIDFAMMKRDHAAA